MLEFAFWVKCSLTLRFNLTVSQMLRQASHFLARLAASWLLGLSGLSRANSLWTSRTIKNNYNNKNNNNNNITIRSQPYAFSVDGSSGELVAAGGTETETQVMIVTVMKTMMVMMMVMKAETMLNTVNMMPMVMLMMLRKHCPRIG